jgi:transposase
VFCSIACKGEWQKTQKPLTRDQLVDLYVEKGLSTYQIGKRVNRDPKRVYEWLVGFGIQPRPRGWDTVPGKHPFHDRAWLEHEYLEAKRSARDIAEGCGVTENNVLFFLHKHGIATRTMEHIRAEKYWGAVGPENPMFGRCGSKNPNWKGGVTPERQAFYLSEEWKQVCQRVWRRDKATCQCCGLIAAAGIEMHIHHRVTFAYQPLRAELSNLVLLCETCHEWVHSNENSRHRWIEQPPMSEADT